MKREPYVDWFDGHPLAAGIVSFFFPGIPHILMGEVLIGILLLILCVGAWAVIAGWVIGLVAAFLAYHLANRVYKDGQATN